ncbi:ABC transporter ATP-binding protein [Paenarthrobacter nicotinovorans]|uniref:ABC transporter ATP-binding protein n=1 Tax=Paenarthrobacter nicotinovorans TaxID=29320 RepID=UPI00382E6443
MTLVVSNVEAGYIPDVNIVNGISVTVPDASMTTIIGPNGSGKSTFLKSVAGLVPLRKGSITVNGIDCSVGSVHERISRHGLAFVPQSDNVFGSLSIEENLAAGGYGMPTQVRKARAEELLGLYPALGKRRRARADSLSGGERQLLAVCRALMPGPRVLLLDEPSAGLSPLKVEELFAIVSGIRDRDGISILVVEQNAVQSLAVSDAGIVLVQGKVALADTAEAILSNDEVADLYLGGLQTTPNGKAA